MTFKTAESSKTSLRKLRVDVMGSPYWAQVVCNLLKRAGLCAKVLDPHGRFALFKWAVKGQWWRFDVIHLATGMWEWRAALVLMLVPRPIIWHWIGTDILNFKRNCRRGWKGFILRLAAYRGAKAHLADSPEVAEELRGIGIQADVVRLLPERIEANVEPLPERFTVLNYWTEGFKDFYGGDIVFQLAKEFPDIEFRIAGAVKEETDVSPNIKFLGFQRDLSKIYSQSTVLIRIPEHDSLSAMVLEMLARGRYVIYNKKLAGCHFATNLEQARKALLDIRQLSEPNTPGTQAVKEHFSPNKEAAKLDRIYANLFPATGRK